MKTYAWLPLVAATAAPAIATAQSDQSADAVVVTATRIAQTTDETLVPVSVLTRDDIDRSPATSLPELLSSLPGLDFALSGGHGKTSSLFLRGTDSGHALVLIDGVRVGSATLGSFPFEQIPLAQIERIEVVRGPRSSLYGSEAIGGVIQIFTRKGQTGTHGHARIGAGNHNTYDTAAGVSWGNERTQVGVNVGYFDTDGIDARELGNNDKDGYDSRSLTLNLSQQLSERVSADLTALRIESENHFDRRATADDFSDNVQQTLGLRLNAEISDVWSLTGGVNEHRDESENFDRTVPNKITTRRRGADIKSDYYVTDTHLLSAGLDFYRDEVSKSDGNYDETQRDNTAVFGQWMGQYGALSVLAGARHDDNEVYGNYTTGNLNLGYTVAPKHRVLASVGTAFKAPTFNDLFWPFAGNPDLQPEKSRSFELGYEGEEAGVVYAARVFRTEIDNLIDWACVSSCGGDPFLEIWQPSNINEAVIRGVELELSKAVAEWEVGATATVLDTEDRSTGAQLDSRAERSLQLNLGRRYANVDWRLSFLAQTDRVGSGTELPGYGVVDFKAGYAIDSHWGLEAKIGNLTDKEYQTKKGFNSLDRTYLLSVTYQR